MRSRIFITCEGATRTDLHGNGGLDLNFVAFRTFMAPANHHLLLYTGKSRRVSIWKGGSWRFNNRRQTFQVEEGCFTGRCGGSNIVGRVASLWWFFVGFVFLMHNIRNQSFSGSSTFQVFV